METINKIDVTIFNNDKGKLRYFRGVVKFFNTLKEFYPDTITQEITCPRKIKTAEKFANGKYYAISKWYEAKIPLITICNKLEEWVRTSNAKIASTNYFKNHDVNKVAQTASRPIDFQKYKEPYSNSIRVGYPFINTPFDEVKQWFNEDAARLGITIEEVVEKITKVLGGVK